MAAEQKGAGAGAPKIKFDEVTAKVVSDPKVPGDSMLVTGFLGASSDSEHTRIYFDPSLSSFVDVSTTDILHTEPLPKDQSPLGGSYIWLKRSAGGATVGQGGTPMTGRFFEGPLMAAYGTQFGGMAGGGAAAFGGAGTVAYTVYVACQPTIFCTQAACQSVQLPCASHYCTRTVIECTGLCPVTPNCPQLSAYCPVASPNCPGPGPGTPVQGGGGGVEAAAMAAQPALAGSYAPHCWYSWNACPTQYGCGPHNTPACPRFEAQAAPAAAVAQPMALPSLVCSYNAGCWYSWGACPTQGWCGGPHHTPNCPQLQYQAQPAAAAAYLPQPGTIPSLVCSYSPGCWYSWGACPTQGWCGGPFHTPNCPR